MNLEEFVDTLKGEFDKKEQANIKAEKNFRELESWNSMMALILIAKIDDAYHVNLSADELAEAKTFHDLFNLSQSKLEG